MVNQSYLQVDIQQKKNLHLKRTFVLQRYKLKLKDSLISAVTFKLNMQSFDKSSICLKVHFIISYNIVIKKHLSQEDHVNTFIYFTCQRNFQLHGVEEKKYKKMCLTLLSPFFCLLNDVL